MTGSVICSCGLRMHVFSDQKSVKCFKCGLIQPVSFRDEVSCRRRRIKRSRSWTEGDLHSDFKASGSKRQRGNRLPTILEDSAGSAGEDEKLSEGYSDPDDPRLCEAKQLETEDKEIDLLKIFECPVCRELLLNPVTLKCGHSLCEECMIQYLENGTGRCKCPAGCQTVIPFYLPPVNVTLRQALNNKLPVRSNLRKSDESKSVSYRREKLADASAICSIIPNGTEGRPLEIVRREIRIMRMQNQQLLNREQIRRALAEGTPRPERHGPEPIFSLPVSALWLLGMMICTTWSLTQKRGIEMLRLDWGKVKQGQVWRLATTFLTLGDRYNMWKSGFSLIRIYFLKSYEPSIGTVKYAQNLLIKAVILLAHDYMLIHGNALQDEKEQKNENDILSHQLVWYMLIHYCLEKPMLFLSLLLVAQVEWFIREKPWKSITLFLLMLLPQLPTIALWLRRIVRETLHVEEVRQGFARNPGERVFHQRT